MQEEEVPRKKSSIIYVEDIPVARKMTINLLVTTCSTDDPTFDIRKEDARDDSDDDESSDRFSDLPTPDFSRRNSASPDHCDPAGSPSPTSKSKKFGGPWTYGSTSTMLQVPGAESPSRVLSFEELCARNSACLRRRSTSALHSLKNAKMGQYSSCWNVAGSSSNELPVFGSRRSSAPTSFKPRRLSAGLISGGRFGYGFFSKNRRFSDQVVVVLVRTLAYVIKSAISKRIFKVFANQQPKIRPYNPLKPLFI